MKKCVECGNCAKEKHHVIPRSLGGVGTVDLCSGCHAKAHRMRVGNRDSSSSLIRVGIAKSVSKLENDKKWLSENEGKVTDFVMTVFDINREKGEILSCLFTVCNASFIKDIVENGVASTKITFEV